jgi:hypothetical protein
VSTAFWLGLFVGLFVGSLLTAASKLVRGWFRHAPIAIILIVILGGCGLLIWVTYFGGSL